MLARLFHPRLGISSVDCGSFVRTVLGTSTTLGTHEISCTSVEQYGPRPTCTTQIASADCEFAESTESRGICES